MKSKELFLAYIAAYNAKDVPAMLALFDKACIFENISAGKVTIRTNSLAELEVLARRSADAMAWREQRVITLIETPTQLAAEIEYRASLRADLTPELKAGMNLQLRGVSLLDIAAERIVRLSDYS